MRIIEIFIIFTLQIFCLSQINVFPVNTKNFQLYIDRINRRKSKIQYVFPKDSSTLDEDNEKQQINPSNEPGNSLSSERSISPHIPEKSPKNLLQDENYLQDYNEFVESRLENIGFYNYASNIN
jgi:hypothetical protein